MPSTLALIIDTFAEQQRGAAIGSWTAWTGIAMVIGPLGGGLVLEVVSWRWIFAVNVVPVALTLWLLRHAPAGHARPGTPIDWIGAALCALGLAGPVLALTEQPSRGWGDPLVALPLIGGVALLVAFVLVGAARADAAAAAVDVPRAQLQRRQPRRPSRSTAASTC